MIARKPNVLKDLLDIGKILTHNKILWFFYRHVILGI